MATKTTPWWQAMPLRQEIRDADGNNRRCHDVAFQRRLPQERGIVNNLLGSEPSSDDVDADHATGNPVERSDGPG